eukprot:8054697-Pyramimonas_sp.AAC.1
MHPEKSQRMQLLRREGPHNVPPLVLQLVAEVHYAVDDIQRLRRRRAFLVQHHHEARDVTSPPLRQLLTAIPKACFLWPTSESRKMNFFDLNPRCARGSTTFYARGSALPVRAVEVRFAPMAAVVGSCRSWAPPQSRTLSRNDFPPSRPDT